MTCGLTRLISFSLNFRTEEKVAGQFGAKYEKLCQTVQGNGRQV